MKFTAALTLEGSPHMRSGATASAIMWQVNLALVPALGWGIWSFGISALGLVLVTVTASVATEWLITKWQGKSPCISDGSVVLTGLLLAMCLPPALPYWMAVCGAVFAVGIGKHAFGGLGQNVFNPALVGRAMLQAAFPSALTTWTMPFQLDRFTQFHQASMTRPLASAIVDGVSSATPLGAMKFDGVTTDAMQLLVGSVSGSLGETSSWLIVVGGIYLALRHMLNWRIPVSILLVVALLTTVFHIWQPDSYPTAGFMVGSGGLMLGAWFMATDMVTSPVTANGVWLFGAIIACLVVAIRFWGGLPEGVMYAILLANAMVPLIDRFTQPRVFGRRS